MGIGIAHLDNAGATPTSGSAGGPLRVLVVYEEGRRGAAVVREAAELAAAGAQLAVVTLAPQAKPLKCCGGGGAGPYNCAVRDAAAEELLEARRALGRLAGRASFRTLVGTPRPPLAEWAQRRAFDVILVPAYRFERGGGRLARELRSATDADIRSIM